MEEKIARISVYFSVLISFVLLLDYFLPADAHAEIVRMKFYETGRGLRGGNYVSLRCQTDNYSLYAEPEVYNAMIYKEPVTINTTKIFETIVSVEAKGKQYNEIFNVYLLYNIFPILLFLFSMISLFYLRAYEFTYVIGTTYVLLGLTILFFISSKIIQWFL